jgi:hypothetical protein
LSSEVSVGCTWISISQGRSASEPDSGSVDAGQSEFEVPLVGAELPQFVRHEAQELLRTLEFLQAPEQHHMWAGGS